MDSLIIGIVTVLLVGIALAWFIRQSRPNNNEKVLNMPNATIKENFASIVCIGGPHKGQVFPVRKAQITLGRASNCDINIPTELVSRLHATLFFTDTECILRDEGSTNGTWVNGQQIMQGAIQPGDEIQIGPGIFVLKRLGQRAPTPTPTGIPSPSPLPAIDLPDEYEHLATLPTGGTATVFKARSRRNGQIVALKMPHTHDPYFKGKFTDEIAGGQQLNHPHIVTVYGAGEYKGRPYMIMEFLEHGSLREMIQAGPLSFDLSVHIIGQMCNALSYIHGQKAGVYHRDIKPENILFSTPQFCKLADFGIAKWVQAITRTRVGMIVGTPIYMSYEQIKGHTLDHRTDIYSLGVVLYEMLTGVPPFIASDPMKVMNMHVHLQPTPPRKLNPAIPPSMEQAVLKALEKDRQRRFYSASDMAQALGYSGSGATYQQPEAELAGPQFTARPMATASQTEQTLKLIRFDNVVIPINRSVTPLNRKRVNSGDSDISQKHAQIVYQNGNWWLHDLASANGTYINGQRIHTPTAIKPGMEIQLGRTTLRVER